MPTTCVITNHIMDKTNQKLRIAATAGAAFFAGQQLLSCFKHHSYSAPDIFHVVLWSSIAIVIWLNTESCAFKVAVLGVIIIVGQSLVYRAGLDKGIAQSDWPGFWLSLAPLFIMSVSLFLLWNSQNLKEIREKAPPKLPDDM